MHEISINHHNNLPKEIARGANQFITVILHQIIIEELYYK